MTKSNVEILLDIFQSIMQMTALSDLIKIITLQISFETILPIIIIILVIIYIFKNRIEIFLAAPFKLIFFIGLLFALFSEAVIFDLPHLSDTIYFITLVILILYTFYTQQIVKITYKGPALVHVQIYHTDILKKFLQEWLKLLQVPDCKYPNFKKFDDEFRSFETKWEYNDLTQNHLPGRYKGMVGEWNKYKQNIIELDSLKRELCQAIHNDTEDFLNRQEKINGPIRRSDPNYIHDLKNNIYILCFKEQNGDCKELSLHISKNDDDTFKLVAYNFPILQNGTSNEMEKIKQELLNFQIDVRARYGENILKIIEAHSITIKICRSLEIKINELNTWPIFPGTKCDMLKDFELK